MNPTPAPAPVPVSMNIAVFQFIELLSIISFLAIAFVFVLLIYIRNKEKNRTLEEENKKEKLITETISQVQENERNRISRDLHDTVTQDIRTALIFVHRLNDSNALSGEEKNLLLKIQQIEEKNLKNIRNIIRNLSASEIENENFVQVISEFVQNTQKNSGIVCKFYAAHSDLYTALTAEQKLHIFRIIQESVTNAVKHSGAGEISVIAREEEIAALDTDGSENTADGEKNRAILFLISDDGNGFPEAENALGKSTASGKKQNAENVQSDADSKSTHLGLKGIKSRTAILGATLEIKSDRETGTQVKLLVRM